MILKAIISLQHLKMMTHELTKLLQKYESVIPCAREILENRKMVYFLDNLLKVYKSMRYGETKAKVNFDIAAKTLDELFFKLDKTWAESIKNEPLGLLYVPKGLQADFLKDNQFFTAEKITDYPSALWMSFSKSDIPQTLLKR
jgi:hypothetical protein